MAEDQTLYCSFCGKSQHEVRKLIAGPTTYICDECVGLCESIIREDELMNIRLTRVGLTPDATPTVQDIHKALNHFIDGHSAAKNVLSVFLHRHYTQIAAAANQPDITPPANNLVLIGAGVVRPNFLRLLMRCFDHSVAIIDTARLTRHGKAEDVGKSIILDILKNADFNIERAQSGFVFFDDFDQICQLTKNGNAAATAVQQEIVRLVSGDSIDAAEFFSDPFGRKREIHFLTTDISFILGGGFASLPVLADHRGWTRGETWDEYPEKSGAMASRRHRPGRECAPRLRNGPGTGSPDLGCRRAGTGQPERIRRLTGPPSFTPYERDSAKGQALAAQTGVTVIAVRNRSLWTRHGTRYEYATHCAWRRIERRIS